MGDHLSRPVVANRFMRPYPGRGGPPHNVPYLVLLQVGFT